MSKKSLITSLILGAVLTLSLGVYTLVSAIIAMTTPHHNVVSVAYASQTLNSEGAWEDLVITDFSEYSVDEGTLELSFENDNNFLEYDAENKSYSLKDDAFEGQAVGAKLHFTAVATTDRYGSTTTYNATVYKQGTGYDELDNPSKENAYLVTNADDLISVQNNSENGDNSLRGGYILQVEDVDLAGKQWKGISKSYAPFMGVYDGDGHQVKNMKINIDASNYEDYLYRDAANNNNMYLSAGFIARTFMATVKGLSVVDAEITVAENLLETLDTYETQIDEETYRFVATRVGIIAADNNRSVIDGTYTREVATLDEEGNPVLDDEQNPVMETKYYSSVVSGKVSGLQYEKDGFRGGFGGLVGVVNDYWTGVDDDTNSQISNYAVNVTINTSGEDSFNYVGGVAGQVVGETNLAYPVTIKDVNVTLNCSTQFLKQNYVGGVAGFARNAKVTATAEKVNTINLNVADADNATISDLNAAFDSAEQMENMSQVAGIAAYANNSAFESINANANISLWARVSAGFIRLLNSTATDIAVSGNLTGFEASGLARETNNATVSYTADEFAAVDVKLYAHNAAALIDFAKNTNITALADTTVKSEIFAYGYNVTNAAKNDIVHSSGLVGYYYATDTGNTYTLQGFAVDTTINNGIDMAGVVAYLGSTDTTLSAVVVQNVTVDAKLNSYSTADYSTTHKVGGAVAVVYGNAAINGLTVEVKFNEDHAEGNKYGVAMFGGLVARVAGEYVTLDANTVSGSAYVNYSLYSKTFEEHTYAQITVGGLVGMVASYGKDVPVGGHPTYAEAEIGETGYAVGDTYDEIRQLSLEHIAITANNVGVDMVVDYVDEYEGQDNQLMYEQGYRTRAAGMLVGLILNTNPSTGVYTATNLSTNVVTGSLQANVKTFTYKNGSSQDISSMGYGLMQSGGSYEYQDAPAVVGATYDLTVLGDYVADWQMPTATAAE